MTSPGSPWNPRFVTREPKAFYWLIITPSSSEEDVAAYCVHPFRSLAALSARISSLPYAEVLLALYCSPEFHAGYYFRAAAGKVTHCYKYGLPEFAPPVIAKALDEKREETLRALNHSPDGA
jgi:hypothetical protein